MGPNKVTGNTLSLLSLCLAPKPQPFTRKTVWHTKSKFLGQSMITKLVTGAEIVNNLIVPYHILVVGTRMFDWVHQTISHWEVHVVWA